jgi:ligand-binding SRPBCC domain-containing protein
MPTLEFESTVAAPLERVWAFYQDVRGALPVLSPPASEVVIESADEPSQVGTRIVILAKGPIPRMRRIRWVARIVEHQPPHAVVFGEEARFVDEQEAGPFRSWRHEHEFERIDEKSTRLVDRVTYRLPLGPIGWIGDWLFVRRPLKAMFRYRHAQTKQRLEGAPA